MNESSSILSVLARKAAQKQDWATVSNCAKEILKQNNRSPEGYFLTGLVEKGSSRPAKAARAFEKALELDENRYDAAIELAHQYFIGRRNADAANLLGNFEDMLDNSPRYLDMAGTTYTDIGMADKAWPLFQKANELQPGMDRFQANLAACGVFLGKIKEAKEIYKRLLDKYPAHQRNHYQLARLEKAKDATHVNQMKEILRSTNLAADMNVFMYYAIGKELEDLEEWDESFHYYKMAGDAVASVANYDVATDVSIIDKIIETCNADWLSSDANPTPKNDFTKTPIFIVGLPRTGTTLTERIVSSHSQVESVGETQHMQLVLRRESGVASVERLTSAMIEAAAKNDISPISEGYMDAVKYRLGDEPMFIDKLPFNYLYLGFIAKSFPHAKIIHLKRHPLDACFAMYKQVFTWAYQFSYTLNNLGRYYASYARLCDHWREVLGDRMIEVEYESLVADQEAQTRKLLEKLGLPFEEACLNFDQNITASTTASSVQVREKIHTRSVNRWANFAKHLQPLKDQLENAGIAIE
jgi:tetratricopeptide (TPR) repeat protein